MRLLQSLTILLALFLTPALDAETTVSSIIGDNMVLQRDAPIVLWGWDEVGTKVTAKIGESSDTATAADDGNGVPKVFGPQLRIDIVIGIRESLIHDRISC